MATLSRAVTVGDEPTALDSPGSYRADQALIIYNASEVTVYLGGADVAVENGVPVAPSSYGPGFSGLDVEEPIFGVVATGTAEVRVLETGV